MENIHVQSEDVADSGWRFVVTVGGGNNQTTHTVTLDEEYWQSLAQLYQSPTDLVRASFVFLLEHEPKESILSQFSLRDIAHYFPEYEDYHHTHNKT